MAMGDPMPYRLQRVRCRKCGDIVDFGEGTDVHPLSLCGGEFTWCNCGSAELWPYEAGPERIIVDNRPAEEGDAEDFSVLWVDVPAPEPTGRFFRPNQFNGRPVEVSWFVGLAPWDGVCSKCKQPIPNGGEFVRLDVYGQEAQWLHVACAPHETRDVREKAMKVLVETGTIGPWELSPDELRVLQFLLGASTEKSLPIASPKREEQYARARENLKMLFLGQRETGNEGE